MPLPHSPLPISSVAQLCWDGRCVSDAALCPVLPACDHSASEVRDAAGRCVSVSVFLAAPNNTNAARCPDGLTVRCPDGSCRAAGQPCPPAASCPVGTTLCPTGQCVAAASVAANCSAYAALLGSTCAEPVGVLCFDGTCARTADACVARAPPPLARTPVRPLAITATARDGSALDVVDTARAARSVAALGVPSGALRWAGTQRIGAIAVRAGARSELALAEVPAEWLPFGGLEVSIFSTPFALTTPPAAEDATSASAIAPYPFAINLSIAVTLPDDTVLGNLCLGRLNATARRWEMVDCALRRDTAVQPPALRVIASLSDLGGLYAVVRRSASPHRGPIPFLFACAEMLVCQ